MSSSLVITGNGRSGTNWVLDILNASSFTHCRNEPHRIESSPFHRLATNRTAPKGAPPIIDLWQDALAWSATSIGERGPEILTKKNFVGAPASAKTFLLNAPLHPRRRAILSKLDRRYKAQEWTPPSWLISPERLAEAITVLKIINVDPRNIVWLLENQPTVPVLHVVRHPGGRLHSWNTRFRSLEDEVELLRRNQARLDHVVDLEPRWRDTFGDIDSMSLSQSELWLWRYLNEVVVEAATRSEMGSVFVYEQLVAEPLDGAKAVYKASGLPWDSPTEVLVQSRLSTSVWGELEQSPGETAARWRSKLSAQDLEAVDLMLETSPLLGLWGELQKGTSDNDAASQSNAA